MRFRVPHVFTLLFAVIVACAALTWVVPSGAFDREQVVVEGTTRSVAVPGTFRALPKVITPATALIGGDALEGTASPVGLFGVLTAIPRGLEASAGIVSFVFVVGAVLGILRRTGVIGGTLDLLTRRLGHLGPMLVAVLVVLIGVAGSTLGVHEQFIPLVPVFVLMSRELGYDRVFGLAIVVLGSMVGFAAATTNPFTVAVAQAIAAVPIASGLGFRALFFAVAMVITLTHLLRYGARVKADPARSLVADRPSAARDVVELEPFAPRHGLILLACTALFAAVVYGVQSLQWWMAELAGGFLAVGLVAALLGRLSADETVAAAIEGLRDVVVAALVVGVARGVVVVLEEGRILDTFVHGAAVALEGQGPVVGAWGMLVFQALVNVVIPSGSGQAAVTMPLMAPLADLVGITRQTAVFAFQCGDGFSNMVIPTSGVLMAMLALADVPYERWIRFVAPLFLQLLLLSAAFLALAVLGGWE